MRLNLLNNCSHLDSPMHRMPAAAKLIGAVALVLTTVLLSASQPLGFALVAAAVLAAAALSRIPPAFLAKRLLLLEPIALGVAVLAVFQPGGWRVFAMVL
ncbi:MAG: hypothetical protein NTY01_13425, partial [Verrucomicrobia bacterium]|nr:hypothetical protein [Verrucomicrobiota bacterium]